MMKAARDKAGLNGYRLIEPFVELWRRVSTKCAIYLPTSHPCWQPSLSSACFLAHSLLPARIMTLYISPSYDPSLRVHAFSPSCRSRSQASPSCSPIRALLEESLLAHASSSLISCLAFPCFKMYPTWIAAKARECSLSSGPPSRTVSPVRPQLPSPPAMPTCLLVSVLTC